MIRRAAMPALVLIIIGTFGGHAVAGPNGLFAWSGYNREIAARRTELASLEAERDRLKHRSVLLDPRKADPDLGEEMIRKDLGLIRTDEVIVPLD
jgi:cell division protein FtsB